MDAKATIFSGTTDTDTLGGRLSRAREAAGYSLPQLARSIGVRQDTLSSWESDRAEPRANRLVTLAGMVGVSPAWLLSGIGEPPAPGRLPPRHREILAEVERLNGLQEQFNSSLSRLQDMVARLSSQDAEHGTA